MFLCVSPDVRLAKHCVQHGQVGRVRGQGGRIRNGSDMVVKVRDKVGVVAGHGVDPPGLGVRNQVFVSDGLLGGGHGDHPRLRGGGDS